MNKTIRFLIEVDKNWNVSITCPNSKEWQPFSRKLCRTANGLEGQMKGYFPLPPISDLCEETRCYCALCREGNISELKQVYQNIVNRNNPDPNQVRQFGHYLFHTLIGNEVWNKILQVANGVEMIELSLLLPVSDRDLYALNWEMMYGPKDFLAALNSPQVAITRLVKGSDWNIHNIQYPPRVLFVIGTTDHKIRPGAEILGLLRQLKVKRRSIHSRVLQDASPEKVEQAISKFRPDVVHFICHGGIDSNGGYLELIPSKEDSDTGLKIHKCYGKELINYFYNCDSKPIVVLSACYSAGANLGKMLGTYEVAPLAAELVAGGVPIVVGMAGRVSDRACRLFTRRFGEALVEGESIVLATAQGRQKAFALEKPSSIDWAFPTIFMADSVPHDYIPVQVTNGDPGLNIDGWIGSYKVERDPVFCCRDEFFDAYYNLFDEQPVLAIYTKEPKPALGRTRLLQEFTVQALRDGHVPCLISSDSPAWEPQIKNVGQLGVELLKAIAHTRKILKLEPPLGSLLLAILEYKKPIDNYEFLKNSFENQPNILFTQKLKHYDKLEENVLSVSEVQESLQHDLDRLVADAHQEYDSIRQANGQAIVLLDNVHQYDEDSVRALFSELLGPFGLGIPDQPVPVVVSFSLGTPTDHALEQVLAKGGSRRWLNQIILKPFQENGEDMLAYERVLLHPFRRNAVPSVLDKSWVFNESLSKDEIEKCQLMFRSFLKGIPQSFMEDNFCAVAKVAGAYKYLIEADDNDQLRNNSNQG